MLTVSDSSGNPPQTLTFVESMSDEAVCQICSWISEKNSGSELRVLGLRMVKTMK